MIFFGNKSRPFDWGPYPLERLKRDPRITPSESAKPKIDRPNGRTPPGGVLAAAVAQYHDLFRRLQSNDTLPPKAPVPDDLGPRTTDLKGFGYFLDVAQIGICEMPENAWLADAAPLPHSHAIVLVQRHGRMPEPENLAHAWCKDVAEEAAELRAFEVAMILAQYIRSLGFEAKAHDYAKGLVDIERLAVLAGVANRAKNAITNPYLGGDFSVTVVTTEYEIASDQPLAEGVRNGKDLGYWLGFNGAVPGLEWRRREKRRSDLGIYPMEQVDRVDEPTTLVFEDEVPRSPRRAEFFMRARFGDLGDKAKREMARMPTKTAFSMAIGNLIRGMIPYQDGQISPGNPGYENGEANSKAIKSLSYFLGSEITGICEIPDYAWYSHSVDGASIDTDHRYAVVMLIDQGYDTMEGASGDDWVSVAQSMRAYMRGAEIAGVMSEMLRGLGFSSRSHTNAYSDVVHNPLVLMSGLGEMSRIGDTLLNPFIGPRLKTVVLTTNMPLEPDKPIDFGLQNFCGSCFKCARECPCDAITWGDKSIFNGYEIWKPDVERCVRYRITNAKGAACGRCMKTCPLNKVVTWEGPIMTRIASWFGVNQRWAKPFLIPIAVWLDDALRHGVRNPVKKWGFDLEVVDGAVVAPRIGTNERDLDLDHKIDPEEQKIAIYPANRMPPPDQADPVVVDRKEALQVILETPVEALARRARAEPRPEHCKPTPPVLDEGERFRGLGDGATQWVGKPGEREPSAN